jgi:threonine aldolase
MFLPVMVHCSQRGSEMICGEFSHTFLFEQGGPAQASWSQDVSQRTAQHKQNIYTA